MGKVQNIFDNGGPGTVSRSIDDVIISVKNAGADAIPFGAPVFMTSDGAVPFNSSDPQDFATFLGFAVRVADKTPETYPEGQFNAAGSQAGVWKAGDVMEVLVRGGITVALATQGAKGNMVRIRKSDGRLTTSPGAENTTIALENVRVRNQRRTDGTCAEVIVNTRNLI